MNILISKIKPNASNPRIIKDDKFNKLCESLKSFPEMLELRPIIVNKDMLILGGNMRFRAAVEIGLKEVHCVIADKLTEAQEKEFIIKDNVSGGEWDWDMLADNWDDVKLTEWGVDIPGYGMDSDFNESEGYGFMNKVTIEFKTFEEAQAYHIKCTSENLKARLS